MEILKREHSELSYLELIETLGATAQDKEFERFSIFSVIIIGEKPKVKEPETFKHSDPTEPQTFGKHAREMTP